MEYFAYETELYEAKNTENKFVFLNSGWKTLYPVRNVRNMCMDENYQFPSTLLPLLPGKVANQSLPTSIT